MERLGASMTPADILLPGTPAEVERRYLTLAERARTMSFGLLADDVVMLDTETTGLSFRNNELIEIAAAKLRGGQIVERFQTFVHPTGPIPAPIVALTGIRDVDVMDAPSATDAVAGLAEFVGGLPVVAHNASFDRTFVESVPGGEEVSDTWIDSLALSRIALPRLSTHKLADMAQAFGCASVTHRAMDDVDALCGLWGVLLCGLCDLPDGLLERLASMHEEVDWAYRSLFAYLSGANPGARFSLLDTRRSLASQRGGARRRDALEEGAALVAPTSATVGDAFAPGGLVGSLYDAYEVRPEQLAMAQEVTAALATSTHRCLEAGTGVGKSMAYLVPEVLYARQNNVSVGVATKTNALTDQLVSHELPALSRALPGGIAVTSLKGSERYPCMRRLDLATHAELPGGVDEDAASDILTAIAVAHAFACQSVDGDLDALGIRWRSVPRDLLACPANECLRRGCPFYARACFVHGARMAAACSDVVVTNHALLLRDIDADNAILPPIRHWVVDEAHSFADEARKQWAQEVSAEELSVTLARLGGVERGIIHGVMVRITHLDCATLATALLGTCASWARRSADAAAAFFDAVHALVGIAGFGGYDTATLWIDDTLRASDQWAAVEGGCEALVAPLEELVRALQSAHEAIAQEDAQAAAELQDTLRRLRGCLVALRLVVLEPEASRVHYAELHRGRRRTSDRLVAELLEVGPELAERWYPEIQSVVYASATLAVGQSFEHFEHSVGLDLLERGERGSAQLASSFDFDNHMSAIVARDLPAPNDRRYLDALEDLLYDVHCAMGGSVLTLFTNRREMERVYDALKPRLAAAGLEVVCQQRNASARRLREQFVSERTLSLFALKSFWEGFDAAGDTLRCVVVCKLPFANPRDPLVRERELRDRRSWWRNSLPEAVLEVKQAAGRLLRTASDTGVFVLADSRVASKRYGATFVDALPTRNCVQLECANVGRYITLWRSSHE